MKELTAAANLDIAENKPVYWEPVRTDDYVKDCEAGRAAAQEMVARMREDENPIPFLAAFREACRGGIVGGFEIGFATEIGIATL